MTHPKTVIKSEDRVNALVLTIVHEKTESLDDLQAFAKEQLTQTFKSQIPGVSGSKTITMTVLSLSHPNMLDYEGVEYYGGVIYGSEDTLAISEVRFTAK